MKVDLDIDAPHGGHVLRQFRRMRGFTQVDAAAWFGVSERTWRRWESRGTIPRPLAKRIFGYAKRRIISKLESL